MKTALWMVDGTTQIVLTPETEWERVALQQIKSGNLTVLNAKFFECMGGYWRGQQYAEGGVFGGGSSNTDVILRIDAVSPPTEMAP